MLFWIVEGRMHLGYIPTLGEFLGNLLIRVDEGADAPGVHSYAWGILGEFADSG